MADRVPRVAEFVVDKGRYSAGRMQSSVMRDLGLGKSVRIPGAVTGSSRSKALRCVATDAHHAAAKRNSHAEQLRPDRKSTAVGGSPLRLEFAVEQYREASNSAFAGTLFFNISLDSTSIEDL